MVSSQEVLNIVERKGPLLPIHIKKEIGMDTVTIGAMLSELSRAGNIRISNLKIGGSPLYYSPDQASKLQDFSKYLNDKEQNAFELLRNKKVLRDSEQEPVIRVALRNIKDFSRMLEVKTNQRVDIYWKWYLVQNKEAEHLIRNIAGIRGDSESMVPLEKQKAKHQKFQPVAGHEEKAESKITKSKDMLNKVIKQSVNQSSEFLDSLRGFFTKSKIEIIEEIIIRKKSELDFIIKVPGSLGFQEYYCKAKNKKKCNEGDLSTAYIQGQSRKLPVLFLTTGDITKKANDMLDNEFKGMIVKKIK